MPELRRLTDLEGTVLGITWSREPCTPYQVRREFLDSPSPYWSGSAGAIYPLMTRLERAGLVRSRAHATGARRSRLYRVTPAGRAALARWVGPPVADDIVGVPPDPLRTRIAFMTVLPPARRRRMLDEVEVGIRTFLELSLRDEAATRAGGPNFELMARGAIAMQRMRLEWVREVIATQRKAALRPSRSRRRPARAP